MIPPDRAEKRNLAQFTQAPILEEKIDSAYMRFTDQTAQELLAASRPPDPDDPEQPGPFVEEWAAVAQALNLETSVRILTDLLGDRSHPYFYARVKGENLGVFEMVDDERLAEPFSIGSLRKVGSQTFTDIWCSFPTQGSQDGPAAPSEGHGQGAGIHPGRSHSSRPQSGRPGGDSARIPFGARSRHLLWALTLARGHGSRGRSRAQYHRDRGSAAGRATRRRRALTITSKWCFPTPTRSANAFA